MRLIYHAASPTLRKTVNHECPGIHHDVDFRLSNKRSTVCQSAVGTQILQSPATSCCRTECYIGRHLHQRVGHGSVLLPVLFSLYTADCRSSLDDCMIDKYADNIVLIGEITDDGDTHYRQESDCFVRWCDQNQLELNVGKTKEMLMELRKKCV